jgi:diaminobutyrate-2-oxoglutarate transaminase
MDDLEEFRVNESNARYYCRKMPALFVTARNACLWDRDGVRYIDFLAGCGTLNYGHNHPRMKEAAVKHLMADGVVHGLDLHTDAKLTFMRQFREVILEPRGLQYRMQFTGPTGTNAVEAALKLARKVTGRRTVVAFTRAFHGVTLGALAATAAESSRRASEPLLDGVIRLPFDGYHGAGIAELDRFEAMVRDRSGGIECPAAYIVETVQGEGGLNVASAPWLRRLADLAASTGALLIVDDVQAGCGRTGTFFSFERAGIKPDLVCLAKSISGLGLPMALLLIKPEHDVWAPGEHNGTFRGNNLAFATATAALDLWTKSSFAADILRRSQIIQDWMSETIAAYPRLRLQARGLGMMLGLCFQNGEQCGRTIRAAYANGVLIEAAGPDDEVLKILPPLTIETKILREGLEQLRCAIAESAAGIESGTPASRAA